MTIATDTPSLQPAGMRRVLITVDQYDRMHETGIFESGSPIELLHGMLVSKDRSARGENPRTVGTAHRWAVQAIVRHLSAVSEHGCELQTQQPIVLPPFGEPEPDAAIIAASPDHYRDRKPGPQDIYCVIEVADSSLEHDRTTKLRSYATAGILQYVILNLVDRVVEVYEQPARDLGQYERREVFAGGESVSFRTGSTSALPVIPAVLLP